MVISCGSGYSCSNYISQPSDSDPPPSSPHLTPITPPVIGYYITQTAPGHQSHTQDGLIIQADRAISLLMIPLAHTTL